MIIAHHNLNDLDAFLEDVTLIAPVTLVDLAELKAQLRESVISAGICLDLVLRGDHVQLTVGERDAAVHRRIPIS